MPTPIGAAGAAPIVSSTRAATAVDRPDQMGKDTFLQLMVAQLRYQNPMQPTDPSTFLSQSAQFSMVEKLEAMATSQQELLTAERTVAASGMVGRRITWSTTEGTTTEGLVTGARLDRTGPVLFVGATEVPLAAVSEIRPA